MNAAPQYVTLRDYLRVARERRLLILLVTVLFGAAGLAYSLHQTKMYRAEAALQFQNQDTQSSLVGQNVDTGGETPDQRAASAASTLIRPPVVAEARRLLNLRGPGTGLPASVSANPEATTNLVIVTATATTASGAAGVANAVARAAVKVTHDDVAAQYRAAAAAQNRVLHSLPKGPRNAFLRSLTQASVARLQQLARVAYPAALRRPAAVPGSPSTPHTVRTTLLGLLVGLTLGLIAAFGRDSLDRRLKSSRQITDEMHMTILGQVLDETLGRGLNEGKGRKKLTQADLENFRILRTNVELLDVDTPPSIVLVTSALPEEGKSTVSLGLALAYAGAGRRTLLVEADLRRPTLARRLGLGDISGLSDYLAGRADPREVLWTVTLPRPASTNGGSPEAVADSQFVAIVAGTPSNEAADLLRTERSREFFKQVREAYDIVIVDSCPLLSVADTLELIRMTDAVVVCVRASRTTRDQAGAARNALSRFPSRPAGVVVTGVRRHAEEYGYGAYAYTS